MQYFIWVALILLGAIFVKSKGVTLALLLYDWVFFSFVTDCADYYNYQYMYDRISTDFSSFNVEFGYSAVSFFSKTVLGLNYQQFRILLSTVALILLYLTVVKYTKNTAYVMALFTLCPMAICVVQIRNWVAFSIVLFGIRFLEKKTYKGYIQYAVCVLIATTLHYTCFFYIFLIAFMLIDKRKLYLVVFIWNFVGRLLFVPIGNYVVSIINKGAAYFKGLDTSLFFDIYIFLFAIVLHIFVCESIKTIKGAAGVTDITCARSVNGTNKKTDRFMYLAERASLLGLMMLPFVTIRLDFNRYIRHMAIISYILISIPAATKFNTRKQYFIRFAIFAVVGSIFYYFDCRYNQLFTVFYACFENNTVFRFLFDGTLFN